MSELWHFKLHHNVHHHYDHHHHYHHEINFLTNCKDEWMPIIHKIITNSINIFVIYEDLFIFTKYGNLIIRAVCGSKDGRDYLQIVVSPGPKMFFKILIVLIKTHLILVVRSLYLFGFLQKSSWNKNEAGLSGLKTWIIDFNFYYIFQSHLLKGIRKCPHLPLHPAS